MAHDKLSGISAFRSSVEGKIPTEASAKATIMGRPIDSAAAIDAVVKVIGDGVEHKTTINLSEAAMQAKAAHVEVVEPPSYVAKDPNAHYTTKYKYDATKNENIGGGPSAELKMQ